MNANQIHMGVDYAYTDYPSTRTTYYPHATRVRVNFVYKVESPHSHKKQTLVECVKLDEDGNRMVNPRTGEVFPIQTVRARQIVATWSEHLVERERHLAKRAQQRELREQQEREREERYEQQRVEQRKRDDVVYAALALINIPRDRVTLNSYEIIISRHGLEELIEQKTNSRSGEESTSSERTRTRQTI